MSVSGITNEGLNVNGEVDPFSYTVKVFELPEQSVYVNLNTVTFDKNGTLWFTGQSGNYGKIDHVSYNGSF